MKRRTFFSATAGTSFILAGTGNSHAQARTKSAAASSPAGTMTFETAQLDKYRRQYEYDLFEDYIPFHDKFVVDHQTGCFLATTDHDGSHENTNTNSSFMGRGIWCYSFLYNNLAKEDKYLDIAKKGADFIMKHRPAGTDYWPGAYTREGEVIPNSSGGYPGDCYIAEGLAEYAKASGDMKYMDVAKETLFKCMRHYDSPDFTDGSTPFPGARNLWYWMLLMWFGTCTLKYKGDPELEKLVARCQDAILNYHQNPKFELMNNYINHDLSRSQDPKHSELAACGHATESTWMMMYEAVRTKNKKLYDLAAERFNRHAIVSKDDVYGGYYNDCTNVDENTWELSKISWAQAFILMNSIYIVENTGAQWAKDMFAEQFDWVQEKLPLKKHGFALWLEPRDRFVTYTPHASRKDNYHHPRHLMLNLASLRRMTERRGKVSGVFG
ncbi:hypothetical protein LLG96_17000 [bacterium]|nr:hypothetical protein [bacterium]